MADNHRRRDPPPQRSPPAKNNKSTAVRKRPKWPKIINLPPSEDGKKCQKNTKTTAIREQLKWRKIINLPPPVPNEIEVCCSRRERGGASIAVPTVQNSLHPLAELTASMDYATAVAELGSTGIDVNNIEASRAVIENEIVRRTEQGQREEAAELQEAYDVIYDTAPSGRMLWCSVLREMVPCRLVATVLMLNPPCLPYHPWPPCISHWPQAKDVLQWLTTIGGCLFRLQFFLPHAHCKGSSVGVSHCIRPQKHATPSQSSPRLVTNLGQWEGKPLVMVHSS